MKKFEAYIDENKFGSMIPENWEAAAEYLNSLIDDLDEDENGEIDRDEVDAIWEAYCHGDYDKEIDGFRRGEELEYSDLKAAGLSEKALDIYGDSDYRIFAGGHGTYTVKIRQEVVADYLTIKGVEDLLLEPFTEDGRG